MNNTTQDLNDMLTRQEDIKQDVNSIISNMLKDLKLKECLRS